MTDIDFDTRPQRPPAPVDDTPRYEPLVHTSCAVCGTRTALPISQCAVRLCAPCRKDLPTARQQAQARFEAAVQAMEAEQAAWEQYQAQLPADVAAKWQQVDAEWKRLAHALNEALRGKRRASETDAQRRALIEHARAAYDAFMAKVERTRHAPQHMLYPVLQRQAQYDAALAAAAEQTRMATEALQEIEQAEADHGTTH